MSEEIKPEQFVIGVLRILMGWLFLWAFLDKTFGLGFATTPDKAWINGGSPTQGYLKFVVNPNTPLKPLYDALAGIYQIVDIVFMLMLLFVGVTLILGIAVRPGSIAAIIFFVLVYLADFPILPPEGVAVYNPLVDEHIIYIALLALFAVTHSGHWIGLGSKWAELEFVKKYPILE